MVGRFKREQSRVEKKVCFVVGYKGYKEERKSDIRVGWVDRMSMQLFMSKLLGTCRRGGLDEKKKERKGREEKRRTR